MFSAQKSGESYHGSRVGGLLCFARQNRDIHDKYASRESGDFPSLRNSKALDRKD